MKELCIDARMMLSSGIGTYLRNLVVRLAQGPFRLHLIVTKEIVKSVPWLAQFDLIISSLPIYSIEEQIQLPFLIPKCDLFWSPHYNVPFLPIRAKHRLVTIHDVNHLALAGDFSLLQRIYAKRMMKTALKRSRKVITVSNFSKKEICKYLKAKPEKIEVIHPGVDHNFFFPHEDGQSTQVKRKFKLPDSYFLFIGNVKPHKNVSGLIKGFWHVIDALDDTHLVIIGKKEGFLRGDQHSEELAKHLKLQERVHFLGHVEEEYLPSLYRMSLATVFPSFYEGFGLPAIEAMCSGSPLAVSNVASLPEVCGDAAVYFDPHRPEEIGEVLKQLKVRQELSRELKEKGLKRSREFCWDKSAAAHLQIFEEICKKG